ncbi:MAG: outer membrane protein assembly factor BamB family protein, partial [Thermoplasmatota archaeon]
MTGEQAEGIELLSEPAILNREVEGAVLVYENRLGKPGKRLRSSVDLAYNYASLEGDDCLYCISSAGRVLWKYQIPSGIFDFRVSLEGKYVAVASNTGGMFYLDNTGKLLWSYSLGRAVPLHTVSPDGSVVVGTTIPPSGKGHTLCIISRAGQVLRHLSVPYEVVALGTSFDGSVILMGDMNNNVAQYSKTGDRQWIYCIRAPIQDIVVSQSGLLIFALTSEIISISPSGTERWRIRIPEGPLASLRMSHDGSVNIACGSAVIFRYDLKGKMLWKHPMPTRRTSFLLSYRSHNIVLLLTTGVEYWDKYGFSISTFALPGVEHTSEDCVAVSQDGRFLMYIDDLGVLRQMDVGKTLARHLISASKIFLEELKRLGTVSQGAEENLQWAIESLNDGDIQYALSFGYQAYTSMETTLDSLPARKPAAPAAPAAPPPAAAAPAVQP